MRSQLWMALAATFYALQYFNVKILHRHNHTSVWTIIAYRGLVGLAVASTIAIAKKRTFCAAGNEPRKLVVRGMVGATSLVGSFLGLAFLRLSVATALLSSTPLWTGLLVACWCSPMRWGWRGTVGAIVCMTGVVLISTEEYTGPGPKTHALYGVFLCLTSSVLNAVVNVTVQGLTNEDPWVISMYPMACSALLAMPGAILDWTRTRNDNALAPLDILSLCSTGLLSLLAQFCRTVSLQGTRDMGVVVLRYLDVPLSVILDIAFLHARPTFITYLGIVLVVMGGVLSTARKPSPAPVPVAVTVEEKNNNL